MVVAAVILVFAIFTEQDSASGQLLTGDGVVWTKPPLNELWCFRCTAEGDKDRCVDVVKYRNQSNLAHKCRDDRRQCSVKRFSYTTSNENSTSILKMWSMERDCAKHCSPGCIVIGERTKLYACTSCCTTSLCNIDNSARGPPIWGHLTPLFLFAALVPLLS